MISIANSLGFGSGIDVAKLVTDLAAASRAPKVARFEARQTAVQASISAVGQARADLEGFSKSLSELVTGGTLQSQPTVSDAAALSAKATIGTRLEGFAGQIEILTLAQGQTLASGVVANATDPIGQGTMRLNINGVDKDIVIDGTNDSLGGLVTAINASGAGVKASVISDTGGVRLVLKGPTGAANAFTLTRLSGATTLDAFATGQLTVAQPAQDASFKVDGLSFTRASNTVSDVVPGVELTLRKAAPGVLVSLGVERPTEVLKSTVRDFVSVFNELRASLADARTATRGDGALRQFERALAAVISTPVTSGPGPRSLSDIGVKTNRDGTIVLDEVAFAAAIAANPGAVEAIFTPTRDATHTAATDPGIGGVLASLKTAATTSTGALASLSSRLTNEARTIAKDREKMESREDAYKARLEKQFGGVDARVGALRATQSYLDQQIKIWTRSQ